MSAGTTIADPIQRTVMIVGGGMSGITAAVEAAEIGCRVYLVERLSYLGGRVAQTNEYFPKLCPPYCGLEINFRRIRQNPRITVMCSSEVIGFKRKAGQCEVRVRTAPQYVTEDCTACGDCAAACPVEMEDPFNLGMTRRKAIDLSHELAFPFRFDLVDAECPGADCAVCAEVCKFSAINLEAKETIQSLQVNSILICSGWKPYDAERLPEYGWGRITDLVNNVMMERMGAPNGPSAGRINRPSTGEPARSVAFVQCAGSRDENHLPYCSSVCCSASLKQAMYFVQQHPDNRADIYYIDLRVAGRNEDFLVRAEAHGQINLIRGKVSRIKERNGRPWLEAENIMAGKKSGEAYDLVVLATGIVPEIPDFLRENTPGSDRKAQNETDRKGHQDPERQEPRDPDRQEPRDPDPLMLDPDGFLIADQLDNGLGTAGCCAAPKDVAASVRQATGAVIKALI